MRERPSTLARLGVALFAAAACGGYRWFVSTAQYSGNDFAAVWAGARAIVAGQNPYDVVGPGRAFQSHWPLAYPGPALLLGLPFAPLPEMVAAALFAALGAGLFAYALTAPRDGEPARWWPLVALLSASMWAAVQLAQWSPLLTAAALLPGLGWLVVAKPNIGLALFAANPRRSAAIGAVAITLVSLALLPTWPATWLVNTHALRHMRVPVTILPFGPLLLLALLRWRRPEARLLAVLACVPTTGVVYDTLPLFLVPQSAAEGVALALATHVAQAWIGVQDDYPTFGAWTAASASRLVPLVYLPALVMVLRRPNETGAQAVRSSLGAWLRRWARPT